MPQKSGSLDAFGFSDAIERYVWRVFSFVTAHSYTEVTRPVDVVPHCVLILAISFICPCRHCYFDILLHETVDELDFLIDRTFNVGSIHDFSVFFLYSVLKCLLSQPSHDSLPTELLPCCVGSLLVWIFEVSCLACLINFSARFLSPVGLRLLHVSKICRWGADLCTNLIYQKQNREVVPAPTLLRKKYNFFTLLQPCGTRI